jgi:hypothetical protein
MALLQYGCLDIGAQSNSLQVLLLLSLAQQHQLVVMIGYIQVYSIYLYCPYLQVGEMIWVKSFLGGLSQPGIVSRSSLVLSIGLVLQGIIIAITAV